MRRLFKENEAPSDNIISEGAFWKIVYLLCIRQFVSCILHPGEKFFLCLMQLLGSIGNGEFPIGGQTI